MCFDLDSHPPIAPIAGGALDSSRPAAHGGRRQPPGGVPGPGRRRRAARRSLLLPDVRGLHPFYEELALRFAEHGVDALAIDWFGRTARRRRPRRGLRVHAARRGHDLGRDRGRHRGRGRRPCGSTAAARRPASRPPSFTLGFCMGGRMSFLAGDPGARAGRRHRVLRHARRPVAERRAGAGRRRRVDRVAGAGPVRRRRRRRSRPRPSPPSTPRSRRPAWPIGW